MRNHGTGAGRQHFIKENRGDGDGFREMAEERMPSTSSEVGLRPDFRD
jgi:hypothetical protein